MDKYSFLLDLLSVMFSGLTLILLVIDRYIQKKQNKMKLILTPKDIIPNTKDEIFYLCLSFSNESALPISILDLQIKVSGEKYSSGLRNGRSCVVPTNILETDRYGRVIRNLEMLSTTLPFVLEPYSASIGYFAFHEEGQDATILCHKAIDLYVITSRKEFKVEMDFNAGNYYDFSYRDDGLIFGEAVYGELYQDTSIPKRY